MQYRAEIDGLRAIAVLPVILFHAGYQWFSGGFIGVDIFFVISGYLITTIILNEMSIEKFSLMKFYERRARRILPALFLAVSISIVLAYFFLLPHQIKDFAQSIVASAFFASNFFFYLETDYFNEFTNKAPLLHTWTLAVEEQFYILFPLLLLAIYRFGVSVVNVFFVVIFVVSIIFAEITVDKNPNLAFYATHTRAWELMIGCLAAYNQTAIENFFRECKAKYNLTRFFEDVICGLATVGILGSIFLFDQSTRHPSLITLIPVVSTVLLLVFAQNSKWIKILYSWKPLVFLGLLSYSLYIFHQPILSFAHFSFVSWLPEESLFYKPILLALVFVVSYLSYRFFEKPLRYNKKIGQRTVLIGSMLLLGIFAVLGFVGHKKDGFQQYFAEKFEKSGGVLLVDVDKEKSIIDGFSKGQKIYQFNNEPYKNESRYKVLIIGDSMAGDTYFSLFKYVVDNKQSNMDVRVLYVDDECMEEFTDAMEGNSETACAGSVDVNDAKRFLRSATTILVTAKWQESTFEDGYYLSDHLAEEYNTNVVVIGTLLFDDITSVSLGFARDGVTITDSASLLYDYRRLDRVVISDKLKKLVLADGRMQWIEKSDFFCNHEKRECQLFNPQGLPVIWDNAHLTYRAYISYAQFVSQYIQ
jgi:peptidoglycan/LPS O-acetylase OafA/YrhL